MNGNGVTPEQWVSQRGPIDDIEPQELPSDLIRDARVQTVRLLNAFGNCIERALADSNNSRIAIAFWGAAYGLGLNCCAGVSMTERAALLNIERASISKAARAFVTATGLSPSFYMRHEASTDSYRESRLAQLNSGNGNGSHEV